MTAKRILSWFVCTVILFNMLPRGVTAYNVGDEVTFQAGFIKEPTNTVESNTDTRTSQQRAADSMNRQSTTEFSQYAENYLETLDYTTISEYLKQPDRYIMVYEDNTELQTLLDLATYKDKYSSLGYYYKTSDKDIGEVKVPDVTEVEMNALAEIISNSGYVDADGIGHNSDTDDEFYFGDFTLKNETDNFTWNYTPGIDRDVLNTFIVELLTSPNKGEYVRQDIVGDIDLIDFPSYAKRFEALQKYIDAFASGETVKTNVIIEYKVESVGRTAVKSSTPLLWPGTNATHFWEFQCIEPVDGIARSPVYQYGGSSTSQRFYYPGKYHCAATQILDQSYWDAITYTKSIYWVLADTGQIIYKDETEGTTIDLSVPMEEQSLENVFYYNFVNEGVFYTTVLDAEIEINQNNLADLTIDSAGVWNYSFFTKRLK